MHTFETPVRAHSLIRTFNNWFEDAIGTEIEIDEADVGQWHATCVELTRKEVAMCREWWQGR